jgi:deoxyhypusine synthase
MFQLESRQGSALWRAIPELHVQVRRAESFDGLLGAGLDEGNEWSVIQGEISVVVILAEGLAWSSGGGIEGAG